MNNSDYMFFYLLLNVLGTYIIFKYFNLFFKERLLIKRKYVYLIALIYYVSISFIHLYINNPILTMIGNLLLFYMISSIYQGDVKKRILSVLLIYLILLFTESVAVLCVSFFSTKHQLILGFAISKIMTIILLGLFNRHCSLKEDLLIPKLQIVVIFVFPIGAIILFYILIEYSPESISLVGLVLLLTFIILIYYILDQINNDYKVILNNKVEYNKKKLEVEMYEQEKLSYQNQLGILKKQSEEISHFRHDLKNHIIGINYLIDNNDIDGLKRYVDRMKLTDLKDIVDTGNISLDSIINFKLAKAKEKNIQYELDIKIPADIDIEPFDTSVIFGNLLENAIEALEKCSKENRVLKIKMEYDVGMLYVVIENRYEHDIYQVSKNKFISSKNKKDKHGIGLENVKRSIERYDGCMEIETDNQVFKVHLFLYI
jgi:hypothetical protein